MPDEEQTPPEDIVEAEARDEEETEATSTAAATVELPELSPTAKEVVQANLGHLMDVGVEIRAVVGHRMLTLEQIVSIQPGTVIDLEKIAGEPIELQVNGKPIASAEIVVIDGRLGARIIKLLDTAQKIVEPQETP